MKRQVPTLNLKDFTSDDSTKRVAFINELKQGLIEYGFIILEGHFADQKRIDWPMRSFKHSLTYRLRPN